MTILIAPDSFKGTFSAAQVARHIASGIPGPCERLPLADGGEGTAAALTAALGGAAQTIGTVDPWSRPVLGRIAVAGDVGILEVASASGLHHGPGDAVAASTYGTGVLISELARRRVREILVGAGGSATTDGGRGAVEAVIERGGLGGAQLTVLTDVETTFQDAACAFGPQKGATDRQVRQLTARLHDLAGTFPRDPRGVACTGAAGGFAGGMWAHFGAELVSGAERVLDEAGFDAAAERAAAVIVGEGRLDGQTASGKIIDAVLKRVDGRLPVYAVCGSVAADLGSYRERFAEVLVASTAAELRRAGAAVAAALAGEEDDPAG